METQQEPKITKNYTWQPWVVVGVVVLVAGGLVLWQFMQVKNLQTQLSQKQITIDSLESDLSVQAPDAGSKEPVVDPNTPVSQTSETDQILSVVDAYVRAPVAAEAEKFEYTIGENTGKFVKVGVKLTEGGGYYLILKKVNDQWTVLFGGQDEATQELKDKYGLPADF